MMCCGPRLVWTLFFIVITTTTLLGYVEGKTKQKKPAASETNIFNFLRIFVMRLVYGFASMIGADEAISDFMGGIFVPPGVEDDYRDYGADGGEDSDDYY